MKKFRYKIGGLGIALLFLLFGSGQIVSADTSFSFSVPEGQGGGNNEFYHGRCVRADVMLDTDGDNTGGADLEINYDNSRIAIVNNNCSTAASEIYHDSQYDNYVNNHVTANKITLGAYNGPGNAYNGSGRFASFYFTVLDGSGNYDLDFEFTLGNTTDTNLAEYGSGDDILDQADSHTLHFADDADVPTVSNRNPDDGAINVPVISNVQFRLNDAGAGIDISTLQFSVAGANWGTTNYTQASGGVSYSCHTTNTNRVDYCDVTLNPSHNFYYNEIYTVDVTISDLGNPIVHTLSNHIYHFTTEPDNDAPQIYNRNPNDGATGISTVTNVNFNLRDIAVPGGYPGTGVDISTLSVTVSAPGWGSQVYTTGSPEMGVTALNTNDYGNVYDYAISINPANDFPENTLVSVNLSVRDYGVPSINTLNNSYSFTTADTIAPVCELFSPEQHAVNMGTQDNVSFHCTDSGTGVDIDSMGIIVNGITYTNIGANTFTYTGDSSDYFIVIDPTDDLLLEYALEVIINGADIANNAIDQIAYGLATGVSGTCPECEECEECEDCEECDDCEDCEECEVCDDIIRYEKCSVLEGSIEEDIIGALPAGIMNAPVQDIALNEINNVDVLLGNNQSTDLATSIISDRTTVVVIVRDDTVTFEGKATPNAKVTLMIESDPIIVAGLSDEQGNWRIKIANIFPNGIHKVSAVAVSGDEQIIESKHLANFEVQRHKITGYSWWYWIVIAILIIINIIQYRQKKKLKNELKRIS